MNEQICLPYVLIIRLTISTGALIIKRRFNVAVLGDLSVIIRVLKCTAAPNLTIVEAEHAP